MTPAETFKFGRADVNARLAAVPPMRPIAGWERVEMTVSCRDTDSIPKVHGAGGVFSTPDGTRCQRMHNGLNVVAGAYHGEWMSEVIRRLNGHHEPQEELLFNFALPLAAAGENAPVMLELGAFWAYYSLWFRSVYPSARSVLVEPDPNSLRAGQRNFELNGEPRVGSADFIAAAVGVHDHSVEFTCESDGLKRTTRTVSVDGLVRDLAIERIHMLHADIQGAELAMLDGAAETIAQGRVNWLFLSTHHHTISGDPLTHQRCLHWLQARGANIVEEHSVPESFSGDGLIVATFGKRVLVRHPPISRNIASRSLFRETEYDLALAWDKIWRLELEMERLSGRR